MREPGKSLVELIQAELERLAACERNYTLTVTGYGFFIYRRTTLVASCANLGACYEYLRTTVVR